jgi:hypothetical protein
VISALNAMKNKNPLTESFLVQLDVDLEGTGIKAMENAKYTFAHTAAVIVSLVVFSLSLLYLQPNIMILPSSNHIARVRENVFLSTMLETQPALETRTNQNLIAQTKPARHTELLHYPAAIETRGALILILEALVALRNTLIRSCEARLLTLIPSAKEALSTWTWTFLQILVGLVTGIHHPIIPPLQL